MAQNSAAETGGGGGGDGTVTETKEDAEFEDANNHDEKKSSVRESLLTKFEQTSNFFWNPSTKQVLGRTWISWGKISTTAVRQFLIELIDFLAVRILRVYLARFLISFY